MSWTSVAAIWYLVGLVLGGSVAFVVLIVADLFFGLIFPRLRDALRSARRYLGREK